MSDLTFLDSHIRFYSQLFRKSWKIQELSIGQLFIEKLPVYVEAAFLFQKSGSLIAKLLQTQHLLLLLLIFSFCLYPAVLPPKTNRDILFSSFSSLRSRSYTSTWIYFLPTHLLTHACPKSIGEKFLSFFEPFFLSFSFLSPLLSPQLLMFTVFVIFKLKTEITSKVILGCLKRDSNYATYFWSLIWVVSTNI